MVDYRETIGKSEKEQTGGLLDDAASAIQDTADDVTGAAEDAVDDASETVDDTVEDVEESGGVLGTVGGAVTDEVDETTQQLTDTATDVADFTAGEGTGESIGSSLQGTIDSAQESVQEFTGGVQETVDNTLGSLPGEAGGAIDEATDIANDIGNNVGSITDDAIEGGQDVVGDVGDSLGDLSDEVGGLSSDVGSAVTSAPGDAFDAFTSTADDLGGAVGDLGEGAGELAGDFGDDFGGLADDAISISDDLAGGLVPTVQNAADALVGGGGKRDRQTPEDGSQPDRTTWQEPEEVGEEGRAVIFRQNSSDGSQTRYFAFGSEDGNTVAYGNNDRAVAVNSVESFGELPNFQSEAGARDAVPGNTEPDRRRGDTPSDSQTDQDSTNWGEPQQVNTVGDASILEQISNGSNRQSRAFALIQEGGEIMAIAGPDSSEPISNQETFDGVPNFSSTAEASRIAGEYQGLSDGQEQEQAGEQANWGESQQVNTVGNVAILEQTNESGGSRYFAITQQNGTAVAISSSGEVMEVTGDTSFGEIPSFENQEGAESAAEAFQSGSGASYQQPEQVTAVGPVSIVEQTHSGDEPTRYFAIARAPNGGVMALESGTSAVPVSEDASYSELPSYNSQQEAESVAQSYIDNNPGREGQAPPSSSEIPEDSGAGTSQGQDTLGSSLPVSPRTLAIGGAVLGGGALLLSGGKKEGIGNKGNSNSGGLQ